MTDQSEREGEPGIPSLGVGSRGSPEAQQSQRLGRECVERAGGGVCRAERDGVAHTGDIAEAE